MRKRTLGILLLAVCAAVPNTRVASAADKKPPPRDPRAPLMLDEIHYYLTDPGRAILFLETHFGARELPQPGTQLLKYITMLGLEPNEPVFEISPPGPFEGVVDADPKTWVKDFIPPAMNIPARYGVYWVGIRTPSLKKALTRMEARGVTVQDQRMVLPVDPRAKAATIYGPDFNVFALVERPHRHGESGEFGIDHVQLLVKNVAENVRFFEDVLYAQVVTRSEHEATLSVAGFTIALADPEGLDLPRDEVHERKSNEFRFEADHLTFLYADIKPAVEAAAAKGRKFTVEPTRQEYFGKPTRYTYATIETPDGLPILMRMEEGRNR